MGSEAATLLISRLAVASIELLMLGGLVGFLLLVFRGINPTWRRRIWLMVLCKPVATMFTAFWGGIIPLPRFTSQSLLHDVLFPTVFDRDVVASSGAIGQVLSMLAVGWLAVAMVLLVRLWCQVQASRSIIEESLEKGYVLKPSALRRLNPSQRVPPSATVIVTPEDHGPITVGVRRPAVIIPEALLPWVLRHRDPTPQERDRLCQVIEHELTHIANRDYFYSLVSHVILNLLWFHPIAHLAYRRFRINCELCCDGEVVDSGAAPMAYVDTLMSVVSQKFARSSIAPRMVGDYRPASILRRRLQYLLSEHERSNGRRQVAAWCVAVLLIVSMPKFLRAIDFIEVRFADGRVESMRIDQAGPLLDDGLVALVDPSALPPSLLTRWSLPPTADDLELIVPVAPLEESPLSVVSDVHLAAAEVEEAPELTDESAGGEQVASVGGDSQVSGAKTAPAPETEPRRSAPSIRVQGLSSEPTSPLLGPQNRDR